MEGNILLILAVFYPIIGALIAYPIGRANKILRDFAVHVIVLTEFVFVLITSLLLGAWGSHTGYSTINTTASLPGFCGLGMTFEMDGFRAIYCVIATFMWLFTTLFSKEYLKHYRNRNRYYMFVLMTLGAVMGVFLSADLYTTFIFFEIMSFTSYVWVVHDENQAAMRAGETYLAIAILGGLVMLMGLFLLYHAVGTLKISELYEACKNYDNYQYLVAAGLCLLFGFGAKAGSVPLHIWLPKAHPVAPAPASALLSGMLTKTGIFGILVISCEIFRNDGKWGTLIVTLGIVTILTGAVLALFSIDLKRTLACSSVSQIGFIMTGIGMQGLLGSEGILAARGTLLHMINHSGIKLVLFLAAGVVYMNLHKLDLNEIRGFGRNKPMLHFVFLTGALSIGGIPLWSGYISKTLIHESIVEYIMLLGSGEVSAVLYGRTMMKVLEWLFLIGGAMTVAYMLKLYIAIFVEKNTDAKVQEDYDNRNRMVDGVKNRYMNYLSSALLAIPAAALWIMGSFPGRTMDELADMGRKFMNVTYVSEPVRYFSRTNLKGGLISIILGVVLYVTVVRMLLMHKEKDGSTVYVNRYPKHWDLEDQVYRPLLLVYLNTICSVVCRMADRLLDSIVVALRHTIYRDSKLPHELEEGTPLTHAIGSLVDSIRDGWNRMLRRKETTPVSVEHRLALLQQELDENSMLIGRTLSFGLALFGCGLLMTLIYMLWW